MNIRHFLSGLTIIAYLTLACSGCIKGNINIENVNVGSNNPTIEFSFYAIVAVYFYSLRNRRRDP